MLRAIRVKKPGAGKILAMAAITAAFSKEMSSLATIFPPACAAFIVLEKLCQVVKDIQSNKESCHRLVHKCARILFTINDQMEGRWDSASSSLLRNVRSFEETLIQIHEFMLQGLRAHWTSRLLRKASIEEALEEYDEMLNDASQAFQLAALINIQLAVESSRASSSSELALRPAKLPQSHSPPMDSDMTKGEYDITTSYQTRPTTSSVPHGAGKSLPLDIMDDHGYRQYHQSDVRLTGRGSSKSSSGWWAEMLEADTSGETTLLKSYGKNELKVWRRDVETLMNIFHPNLPQMKGFSQPNAPTPFILLSHVRRRSPQNLLLDVMSRRGLAACVTQFLQFYSEMAGTVKYLQKQLGCSEAKMQDFLETMSFTADGDTKLIVGLPEIKEEGWLIARSYTLTDSIESAAFKLLPYDSSALADYTGCNGDDVNERLHQLISLLKQVIPCGSALPGLPTPVQELLDHSSARSTTDTPVSFSQLRNATLESCSGHTWRSMCVAGPQFAAGDFGYIPASPVNPSFKDFVVLGNIFRDGMAVFDVTGTCTGSSWNWTDLPMRRSQMHPFVLSNDEQCWPVVVPPGAQIDCEINHERSISDINDAWRLLLQRSQSIAVKHDIQPHELILVTKAGTTRHSYIRDFATFVRNRGSAHTPSPTMSPLSRPNLFAPRPPDMPSMMYQITSLEYSSAPYWSDKPYNSPEPPQLDRKWLTIINTPTQYLDWIRLHPDDFL